MVNLQEMDVSREDLNLPYLASCLKSCDIATNEFRYVILLLLRISKLQSNSAVDTSSSSTMME